MRPGGSPRSSRRPRTRSPTRINAGCYVFRRSVIDQIPPGQVVSVERETFPELIAAGAVVMGYAEAAYWLDVGTPEAFVRGSCDLVLGALPSPALPGAVGAFLLLGDAQVAADALLSGGTTVGAGAVVEAGAIVQGSVIFDGAAIGAGRRGPEQHRRLRRHDRRDGTVTARPSRGARRRRHRRRRVHRIGQRAAPRPARLARPGWSPPRSASPPTPSTVRPRSPPNGGQPLAC